VEAVEADELARVVDLEMAFGLDRPLGPGRRGVAGDERQPADPAVEAVAAEDPPDAVGADDDAAPALLGEARADPARAETGLAEAERDHPLLDEDARLVRHPRRPPLPGPEHLQATAQDRAPPAVVGRRMDAHDPTRRPDVAELGGQAEQPQAEPVEDVIIDHGAAPRAHRFEHDKHGEPAPLLTRRSRSQVSGELGDCSA
jgi:hypothetical protein